MANKFLAMSQFKKCPHIFCIFTFLAIIIIIIIITVTTAKFFYLKIKTSILIYLN
jgi:hypothetical protein